MRHLLKIRYKSDIYRRAIRRDIMFQYLSLLQPVHQRSRFLLSNKELIADINLCTTRGDLYSGIPATTIEELRKLRFDEVQDFTFTVYPRERSYNVEIKEGKELPYDHLMTMEVDSLLGKYSLPEYYRDHGQQPPTPPMPSY